MKPLTQDIDLNQEARAMADFISRKWAPIDGLLEIVEKTRLAAVFDSRGMVTQSVLGTCIRELLDQRLDRIRKILGTEGERSLASSYDRPCFVLKELLMRCLDAAHLGFDIDGPWDYSKRVKAVYRPFSISHPSLAEAKPVGWEALLARFDDHNGLELFDRKADESLFQGSSVDSGRSHDFIASIALPYAMQSEVGQGSRAPYTLICSIYSHFSRIQEYLNTQQLCSAIKDLADWGEPAMDFSFVPASKNKILGVYLSLSEPLPNHADYIESLGQVAAFNKLPPEEKESLKKASQARMLESIKSMTASDGEDRKATDAQVVKLLRESLGVREPRHPVSEEGFAP